MSEPDRPLLELRSISKKFPSVRALDDVSLSVQRGQVMALAGENGAGKSTLVKIISGAEFRDGGDIRVDGQTLSVHYTPSEARRSGIAMIYQELSLLPQLTVAENVFLTHEPLRIPWLRIIDYRRMRRESEQQLQRLQADHIDVMARVNTLPLPEQHMVEIAKALAFRCKIFVMDEPTTSLSWQEIRRLFDVVRSLKEQGVTIIYISHHLDELFQIADSVTVLRDGKVVGQVDIAATTKKAIIHMMTGKQLYHRQRADVHSGTYDGRAVLLDVRRAAGAKLVHDVSFRVYENEVLGFGGLVGSKRTELARAIFGADKLDSGELYLHGKRITIASPTHAVQRGIGYLSENRKEEGLSMGMSLQENIVHTNMRAASRGPFFLWKWVRAICARFIDALHIKGRAAQAVAYLSGGNQQKVVLAKWLHAQCQLLIFDEPTRGIDVGAKVEIHKLIRDFAQEGRAAVVISSDLNELVDICDRVVVMSKGIITHRLESEEITQDNLLHCITMQEETA